MAITYTTGTSGLIDKGAEGGSFNTEAVGEYAVAASAASDALVAKTAAELAETNAAADLVLTNADVQLTHADVVLTNADVVLTNADVVSAEADKVQTGLDRTAVSADLVLTNADVVSAEADKVQTGLDKIATNADVVLTNADVVSAEADKVQTGLDKTATNADVVLTNADVVLTNADVVTTNTKATIATTKAAEASASESNAATSATSAATSATAAQTAQTAAELAEVHAETAEVNAETAETAAELAETHAETAETAALASQTAAAASQSSATASASSATASASSASTSATGAQSSEDDAATSESNAAASATASANSATASSGSATASSGSAATSSTQAGIATTKAGIATTKAAEALTSANNSASSATAAQSSEDDAAADLALTNADVVLTNADVTLTHADVALTHADVILAEADKVQTGLDRVATAADVVTITNSEAATTADLALTNADVALTNADVISAEADKVQTGLDKIATNADVVLTNADVVSAEADKVQTGLDKVATNADVVLTNADVQLTHADVVSAEADKVQTGLDKVATNADVVLTNADVVTTTTKASEASTSASNASTSASSASTAKTAAEAARDAALAAFDSFDDRYLGSKTADPTVDNDGNALAGGSLYFNSTSDVMKVYEGSSWVAAYASLSGALLQTNNLSDVSNVGTARTNLGVNASTVSLPKAGGAMTGAVTTNSTFDGRDVATDGTKLDTIETSATADQTDVEIRTAVEAATDSNVFTDADHTKLNAIEASATIDQTAAEIKSLYEAETSAFTDAQFTKLGGIETSATADQTDAEIRIAVEAATDSNVFTDADHTKLNAIEASATADQTNAEIKTAYEANANTNEFSDTEQTKLAGIEASATIDQTDAEIRTAVEAATDSNVFTDADHTKLNAIEASANVTDTANVVAALTAGTNISIAADGTVSSTDTNTTYTVGNGGLTQVNFTTADNTKLDGVEASADVTDTLNVVAALTAGTNVSIAADGTVSSTDTNTTYTVGNGGLTQVNFTTADNAKLDAIEASADVTDTLNVVAALTAGTNVSIAADGTISSTDTNTDTNTTYTVGDGGLTQVNFTTADNTKLDGIAASANNYSLPASVVHDTEAGALHATDALSISGHTITLKRGDATTETVVVPDNNTVYTHPSNHAISVITGLQAALNLKAPLASPALTGAPTAPTAVANTNTTQVATTAYVQSELTSLIGGAPGTLDTLNELAAAINDDASYSSTLTTALGTKVAKTSNQALSTSANAMTISGHTITLNRGDGTTDTVTVPDNNTTYSVGDGGLSQINFTSADHTKLNGIAASANNYSLPSSVIHQTELSSSVSSTSTTVAANSAAVKSAYDRSWPNTHRGIDDTPVNGQTAESISSNWAYDHAASSTGHPRDTRSQIAGTYNNYSHPTGAGNNHVPTGGAAGQFLKYSSSGVATWATPSYTTNTDTNTWRSISNSVTSTSASVSASSAAVKSAYDRSWPNTTYSVGDGGLSQINFTSADHTKLNGIATSANNYSFPYTVSTSESVGTVARRNSSGYFHASYFNGSGTFSTSGAASGMGRFTGTNGTDTYGRSYTAAAARTLLNVENGATADQTGSQILALFSNSITAGHIAANAIGASELNSNIVNSEHYVDGSIDRVHLAADVIDSTKLANDSVNSEHYVNGSIDAVHIASNSITATQLAANCVGASELADNSVGAANIIANSITAGDIAPNAIGASELNSNIVNSEHYVDRSIDAVHIATGTITANELAANSVAASEIAASAVGASELNVSGNGTTSQYLRSDGDGTMSWVTPPDTNTDTNTTYSADGNYGMTLSGTSFRLEDDRRRNSSTTDVYSGNTHDFTLYDATIGIRWYTAGAEDMRLTDAGDLHVDGNITAYSTTISDERLKTDISTLENPIDKIMQIRGVEFTRIKDGIRSAGVIAQELEVVLPQAITESQLPFEADTETMFKTVDYDAIHALLIEAIKAQQVQIEELKALVGGL